MDGGTGRRVRLQDANKAKSMSVSVIHMSEINQIIHSNNKQPSLYQVGTKVMA